MKLVRWLFLMPMLFLLLILVPTGALAEEIKDTSEGNVPLTIIDDTTGASPANGTVTLPDYIYYQKRHVSLLRRQRGYSDAERRAGRRL